MSSKTYKKKRKKYSTRLEKNKNIYYKNNSVSTNDDNNKKNILILILVVSIMLNSVLLVVISSKNNSLEEVNNTLEKERDNHKEEVESLEKSYTNYLFLGDSITEYYDLDKYFPDIPVVNSGISGDTTDDILSDMKGRVYDYNPSKVFILIGTNDLLEDKTNEEIFNNIKKIVDGIKENRSEAEIYIESIYPVNRSMDKRLYMVGNRQNKDIIEINKMIKDYCTEENLTYINTYDELLDEDGNLKKNYSKDGLHLSSEGYEVVTKTLEKYLNES